MQPRPDTGRYGLEEAIRRYGVPVLNFLRKVKDLGRGQRPVIIAPTLPPGEYVIEAEPGSVPERTHAIGLVSESTFLLAAYQQILSWTVTASRRGYLREIAADSNNPAFAEYRITVAGDVLVNGETSQDVIGLDWKQMNNGKGLEIKSGLTVLIECRSDGVNNVTATGLINGVEEE